MTWLEGQIGDFADIKHGFAFKGEHFSDEGQRIVLTPGHCFEGGGFRPRGDKEKFYDGPVPDGYLLSRGDTLVVMTDLVSAAPVLGASFRIPEDDRYLHNQRLGLVSITRPGLIDERFLYHLFNTYVYRAQVRGSASGATVRHTSPGRIKACRVRYPDTLREQARIAEFADSYDDLIENNRRRIALLAEAARLLYREWFVHLRFPGHEHAAIADGLPQGWCIRALSSLCPSGDGIQTGPFGSQLHQSDYSDDGVPVIMPKDIAGSRLKTDGFARIPEDLAARLSRHRMEVGDTVYGRRGDIGRRAYIGVRQRGWLCGTGSLRIRPNSNEIVPRYLFDTLGSPATSGFIANQAKGSTMPNLSAGALQRVPVLCPPQRIQELYAAEAEPIAELIEVLSELCQQLAKARDLLLPRLMSGEIAV
ncbi:MULTISPECIES: restriction endonuclease subunit S [Ramlibacter]|uniref:Type I restriction modification DNA specificity domain-containing protein n=1 Tax=Ramlibacter pinisoli TaxID=2682844 RepID=A0A6N8IMX5_9BURK|nr:restriction endonuclease subunit S [Ramlibacter sp. CGMCC 1.13660]MVQ28032.1 hypothetical protein [Ramlibacter pinisoli]